MGKRIKYSGFQNDTVFRVFKKNYCSYNENLVHETLVVKGKIKTLNNRCDHYSYKTYDLYNQKLTNYS